MNIASAHEPTISARVTRTIGVALAVLLAATALVLFNASPASAATQRYWSGAGADAKWTNPANWGGVAPKPGDDLLFGIASGRTITVNDFPTDTVFGSITLAGPNYDLRGNRLSLARGLRTYYDSSMPMAFSVSLVISVNNAQTFTTQADHTVWYTGGIVLNADLTLNGAGFHEVRGPLSGAGALIGANGRVTVVQNTATTGATKVVGGVVDVIGNQAGRPVNVNGGGLAGFATVGPVTVSRGYLTPTRQGQSTAAILTVKGDLSMTTAATYEVYVNGSGPGKYGQMAVTGKITLANTPLAVDSFNRTAAITVGQVLTIVKNSGPTAVSGIFDDVPEGATVRDRHDPRTTYRISYKGGASGRDITLTVLTYV